MTNSMLISTLIIPVVAALLVLASPNRFRGLKEGIALLAMLANLVILALLYKTEITYALPWAGFGFEFTLRLYSFSAFITTSAAFFGFLIMLYSSVFLFNKNYSKLFYTYFLITFGLLNGAVLSSNLLCMLFFWEGLLVTLFGMIALGNKNAFRTATKAFIIVGVSDLCMMVGIAIYGYLAKSFTISNPIVAATGLGAVAFLLLMIGAIAKAGAMPFHSWIPNAATDAPLPFMALLPGAVEKLVGIYFLTRISLDMFKLAPNSWLSYTLMIIGSITILLAVMMALVQKDYKRLLSYHAISQIGYMVLGIGTLVPAGIIGGLFHMINNSLYKSGLFLTGGSVERQTGTTDLEKLGGMGIKMPVTFACFIITALSISGVPPFNGFFSKELVYDGALERGWIFYLAALIGSFLTAASFLKLGHAAYLGRPSEKNKLVKEAPIQMLIPMIVIAAICILFGVYNALPINIIQGIVGIGRTEGHTFSGFPPNMVLVALTLIVLAAALLNHIYGLKRTGSGLKAVDHIHYAPGLSQVYDKAEKGYLDPFNIGMVLSKIFSHILSAADKAVDWIYNVFTVKVSYGLANAAKRIQNGNYKSYIVWSLATAGLIIYWMLKSI